MMNGVVTLESEPGKGSLFRFTFRNVAITHLAATTAAAAEPGGDLRQFAPAKILVADDVALNRTLIAGYLDGTGHTMITATNGLEAIQVASAHLPDLILMDMRMPEVDGQEATLRLKADPALRHIPVIAVTASSFLEEEAKARGICDGFIRKPFNGMELAAEMRRFLKPAAVAAPVAAAGAAAPEEAAEEATAEQAARRPDLLKKLEHELQAVWPRLCETRSMGEIEEFARRLGGYGGAGGWPALRKFASRLDQQVQEFDLEQLPRTLAEFPEIAGRLAGTA
jgi:CheY-like chemotaxis protein